MRKLVLLAATALSACNFAPQYRQPIAPIADSYVAAVGPSGQRTAPELGWQEFFLDPRLRTLIGTALERNRDVAAAAARIAQARAQFRIQDSQRLPLVELNGTGTRSKQPISALGGAGAIPGAGEGSASSGPAAVEFTQYAANAGVSAFELDLWGRLRNLAEAERLRYLSSVEGARTVQLTLIAQVAAAYYDIRAGEERLALAERTLNGRAEGVRIAQRRLDAGVTSTIDYDQAVLLLTQAQTEQADIRRTTEQSRNLLEVLVGGPLAAELPMGSALDQNAQVLPVAPGLPSALLAARPDVLEAEFNLRAANANIGAAKAAFFPSISLTGAYGLASSALSDLFKSGSEAWSFGGALNLPIFDWGQRSARLRLSRAQADELVATYQKAVQGAFQEVADALVARQRYAEQITAQTRTVSAQQRLARTARKRYDNGIAIYLEVLDAERNLFSAEQSLLQLRATQLQNDVTLYTALGGGITAPRSNE